MWSLRRRAAEKRCKLEVPPASLKGKPHLGSLRLEVAVLYIYYLMFNVIL